MVQYKKEQQQEHLEQGRIPQEPTQPFRMNSPLNMDKEVYPPSFGIEENLYTNLLAETPTSEALYIPMHIRTKLETHVIPMLIDTGAMCNVLSQGTVKKLGLNWTPEETKVQVTNIDGSNCGSGIVNAYCDIPMKLDDLWKTECFHQAEIGTDQVILGLPWLENFDPTINWAEGMIAEVLEVLLHLPKVKRTKMAWKGELFEGPTTALPPWEKTQGKEKTNELLMAKLQTWKLNSKEELEQGLLQDYLEDLRCTDEAQKQDHMRSITSRKLGEDADLQIKGESNAPWSGEHCPKFGIRLGGEQEHASPDNNEQLEMLAMISPMERESSQPLKLEIIQPYARVSGTERFQDTKPESDKENIQKVDKQIPLTKTKKANPIQDELCDA